MDQEVGEAMSPDAAPEVTVKWLLGIWIVKPTRAERMAEYYRLRVEEQMLDADALNAVGLSIPSSRATYERWLADICKRTGGKPAERTDGDPVIRSVWGDIRPYTKSHRAERFRAGNV